jgi:hypothetical protein
MRTDTLIRALATDAQPAPRPARLLVAGGPVALGLALIGLWLVLGPRDDLVASLGVPQSALRFVLSAALALIGLRMLLTLARPEGRGLVRLWPLAAVGMAATGLVAWAWLVTPPDARQMALTGKTIQTCLVTIPILSILPVAVILTALRRGATTAPALAGFAAGLCGSAAAAVIYALHCTEDSPLFYVTWYGLAMLGVMAVATLVGARLLRW